ncbi:hypothetical protein QRQ56_25350 [Bradyrhizobium sp. U531]|uniref:hypothetical protein n=1 Tax=Bradyrhizobium sp. U531 TaxID=3053458 RepID=UPI003F43DBA6
MMIYSPFDKAAVTNKDFDPHQLLLFQARQFASYVARYRDCDCEIQERLHEDMAHLIDLSNRGIEAAKRSHECRLAFDIRDSVLRRWPFERQITSVEAELVRRYYSAPCVSHLVALSGAELSGLADLLEGWSQDERLDCRSMIELLGWSDGLRSLVDTVGLSYTPLPWPDDVKPPLFKLIATKMLGF